MKGRINDTFRCAWHELVRRKRRTLTNVFGYLFAVAMMIILVGSLLSSQEKADQILTNTGTHFMALVPACTPACQPYNEQKTLKESEGFVANGIFTNLFSINFIEEVRVLPTVKDASAFLLFQFRDPKDNHLFTVGGFDPKNTIAVSTTSCAPSDVVSGRFLTPADSSHAMIEEVYARLRGLHVNDHIIVSGDEFTVVGIVNTGIRPAKANIYLPYGNAEHVINKRIVNSPIRNQANVLLVEAKNAKVQDAALQSIKVLFPSLSFSSYNCYKPAAQVMGLNGREVWLLTVIIALATIIISLKSQYSSVLERRREIGILKSIGWSNRNVVSQILAESVLQATIGGILGCLVASILIICIPAEIMSGDLAVIKSSVAVILFTASFTLSLLGAFLQEVFPL